MTTHTREWTGLYKMFKHAFNKTTVFNIDLIWRIVAKAVKSGYKHNTVLLTSPDETINQSNLNIVYHYTLPLKSRLDKAFFYK